MGRVSVSRTYCGLGVDAEVREEVPYGSEGVWKGCVFPRPAAPAVHATLPNDF